MTRKADQRLFLALLLLCTQAHACESDAGSECGGVGCTTRFEVLTAVYLPLDVVENAEITVCRNAACHNGKFSTDSGIGKDGRSLPKRTTTTIILSRDSRRQEKIFAEVLPTRQPDKLALDVYWDWDWSSTPNARRDAYDISIQADGKTLYSTRRFVEEYSVFQPNGAEPPCGGLTCGRAESVDEELREEVRELRGGDDRDAG